MRIEAHDGVTLLTLDEGKGNAIDPGVIGSLAERLAAIPDGPLVITGTGRFFSTGLALPGLMGFDRAAMRTFIASFEAAMLVLFRRNAPVVAAINGHAIAGGCVIALQCDARIGAAPGASGAWRIGLNEAAIGLGLPALVVEAARLHVHPPALGPMLTRGTLFEPEQAVSVGLLDRLVAPEALLAEAIAEARALGAVSPVAFAHIKGQLRGPTIARVEATADAVREGWLDTWFSPAGRAALEAAVAKLSR